MWLMVDRYAVRYKLAKLLLFFGLVVLKTSRPQDVKLCCVAASR